MAGRLLYNSSIGMLHTRQARQVTLPPSWQDGPSCHLARDFQPTGTAKVESPMLQFRTRLLLTLAAGGLIIAGIFYGARLLKTDAVPDGFASGNGRIEAAEIDIAAKTAGRVEEIDVKEGDFVTAGQVLARMDTEVLEARKKEAQALLRQAGYAVEAARSQVNRYRGEKEAAQAVVRQRQAEIVAARNRLERSRAAARENAVSAQRVDDDRAAYLSLLAMLHAAEADVKAVEAAIVMSGSQVIGAESSVEAAQATLQRIEAEIRDSVLKAPCSGRVQYRVAQPGEVLGAGGIVLNMINLADVYMTFFLPTAAAGKLAIGSEARLILDAAPRYVVPATISFVADVAQFTPKTVETASERQKLMFRVKAQIAPELLSKYITNVKTGLPGSAYVRIDPRQPWPEALQVRLPP